MTSGNSSQPQPAAAPGFSAAPGPGYQQFGGFQGGYSQFAGNAAPGTAVHAQGNFPPGQNQAGVFIDTIQMFNICQR